MSIERAIAIAIIIVALVWAATKLT